MAYPDTKSSVIQRSYDLGNGSVKGTESGIWKMAVKGNATVLRCWTEAIYKVFRCRAARQDGLL